MIVSILRYQFWRQIPRVVVGAYICCPVKYSNLGQVLGGVKLVALLLLEAAFNSQIPSK